MKYNNCIPIIMTVIYSAYIGHKSCVLLKFQVGARSLGASGVQHYREVRGTYAHGTERESRDRCYGDKNYHTY